MKISLTLLVGVIAGILVAGAVIYTTPLRYTDHIPPTIEDVSATDFYAEYSQNPDDYVFLDVRGPDSYHNLHAEGSLNMPLHLLYNTRHSLPKEDKEIVLICSGGVASGVGYSYLEHYGFTNIRRIEDGIESWEAAGLPIVEDSFHDSHADHDH